jgi:hypothetical protein
MNPRQPQSSKIKELRDALHASGFFTISQQAKALGLGRSTTWSILQGNHKGSGLSAATINRMLRAPQLPPLVRAIVLVYVDEKLAGSYGHGTRQLSKFYARLSDQSRSRLPTKLAEGHAASGASGQSRLEARTLLVVADVGS